MDRLWRKGGRVTSSSSCRVLSLSFILPPLPPPISSLVFSYYLFLKWPDKEAEMIYYATSDYEGFSAAEILRGRWGSSWRKMEECLRRIKTDEEDQTDVPMKRSNKWRDVEKMAQRGESWLKVSKLVTLTEDVDVSQLKSRLILGCLASLPPFMKIGFSPAFVLKLNRVWLVDFLPYFAPPSRRSSSLLSPDPVPAMPCPLAGWLSLCTFIFNFTNGYRFTH